MILAAQYEVVKLEETINAKERSLRVNIKGMEENLDNKMEAIAQNTRNTIGEFSKRIYR